MPAVDDVLECVSVCRSVGGQNLLNVLHVKVVSNTDLGASMTEIANAVSAEWSPIITSHLPSTTEYQGMRVREVAPGVTQIVASQSGAGEGTYANTPLPDHVSLLVSLRNPNAPIRIRGRVYLPPGDEATNDDTGRPGSAYRASWKTALEGWFGNPIVCEGIEGDSTVRPGLFAPSTNDLFYYVENVIVRTQWTSQRRRRGISRPDQPLF
jgi:hypothetical protein